MRDWLTDPDRRYPPTPYRPRSRETAAYRDGWDRGWAYVRSHGVRWAVEHYRTRPEPRDSGESGEPGGSWYSGPYWHGYRDGVAAQVERQRRIRQAQETWRREHAAELAREEREERRRLGAQERPY